MLGLAEERFSRGEMCDLGLLLLSAARSQRRCPRHRENGNWLRRFAGLAGSSKVVRARRISPSLSVSDTALSTYIGRDRLNASIGQFPGGAPERMGEIRRKVMNPAAARCIERRLGKYYSVLIGPPFSKAYRFMIFTPAEPPSSAPMPARRVAGKGKVEVSTRSAITTAGMPSNSLKKLRHAKTLIVVHADQVAAPDLARRDQV